MSKLLPLIAASAVGLGVLPPVAEAVTIGTLPPVTTQVVNNGPGNQTDPHVSGDLVTYTSDDSPASTNTHVHHHDLVTGADAAVPNLGAMDFLSDLFGGTTVFTRVDGLESAIFAVGGGIGPVEVAPEASASHRRAPAIGGGIVAFQDFSFTGSSIEPEVVVADLGNFAITRLTANSDLEHNIAVSPNGNVVVFSQCNTSATNCDVGKATRAGGAWTVNTITGAEGEEWGVDAGDGVIAYTSTRGGQTDIYLQPVAGGAEQELALAGEETNPNVSGNLVAFERQLAVDTPRDVYIYDLARDTLYQLTSTPGDEWLSDISVSSSGLVRVVYMVLEEGNFNVYARSFELPNTLAAQVQQPVNSDGSSTFNAKRGVVPLKFTLSEEGNPTCQLPLASLRLTRLGGVSPGPIDEQLYSGSPDSGTQFRIADCHYHYNLNPRGLGAGSYLAEILIDGSPVGEARFDLK